MDNIEKYLYEYLRRKTLVPSLFVLMMVFGFFLFYCPSSSLSVGAVARKIYFTISVPFVIWFLIRRFGMIAKILLDVMTGCKKQVVIAKVYIDVDWEDYDSLKDDKNRYHTYVIETEQHKKYRILKDEKICDYRLVKGNIHTMSVLRYSKFLLSAQQGKKCDGSLS